LNETVENRSDFAQVLSSLRDAVLMTLISKQQSNTWVGPCACAYCFECNVRKEHLPGNTIICIKYVMQVCRSTYLWQVTWCAQITWLALRLA